MPDVVALQEVTATTAKQLQENLSEIGLPHSLHSFQLDADTDLPKNRSLGVMIASRFPMVEMDRANVPWAEKSLSVALQLKSQTIDLHSAYIPPGSSNGWVKIETIEAVVKRVLEHSENPKILCGDFNCPQKELDDGTIITWGQELCADGPAKISNFWRGRPTIRWDDAERSLFTTLTDNGIRDVYRKLNGPKAKGYSWVLTRKGSEFRRRYDHVFATNLLKPVSCDYLHEPRLAGLSDHSPILVDFDFP